MFDDKLPDFTDGFENRKLIIKTATANFFFFFLSDYLNSFCDTVDAEKQNLEAFLLLFC